MFCVLVRHREWMVWVLSHSVVMYSERRMPLLIFLCVVCGWPSFMYCFCIVIELFVVF